MREQPQGLAQIDEALLRRVAALPRGGQRWLKTALTAIDIIETSDTAEETAPAEEARGQRAPTLDEVLSGDANLRAQAEAYPELASELREIADIADLLREAGERRRHLGEEVLRKYGADMLSDIAKRLQQEEQRQAWDEEAVDELWGEEGGRGAEGS